MLPKAGTKLWLPDAQSTGSGPGEILSWSTTVMRAALSCRFLHSFNHSSEWEEVHVVMCLFVCPIFVQRIAEVFFQQETVAAIQRFAEIEADR